MPTLEQLRNSERELKDAICFLEEKFTAHVLRTGETDPSLERAITSLRLSVIHNQNEIVDKQRQIEREKNLLEEQAILFAMGYDALQEKLSSQNIPPNKARQICYEIYQDFKKSYAGGQPFRPLYGDLVEYIEAHEDEIDEIYFSSQTQSFSR